MRASRVMVVGLLSLSFAATGWSQQRVASRNLYERVYCVVPMVGAGTYEDPRRPKYAPTGPLHLPQGAPGDQAPSGSEELQPARRGILGFSFVVSEDGQFALAEFVAATKADLKEILADPSVKSFVKGRTRRLDIETEFRRFKADINLDRLEVSVP